MAIVIMVSLLKIDDDEDVIKRMTAVPGIIVYQPGETPVLPRQILEKISEVNGVNSTPSKVILEILHPH